MLHDKIKKAVKKGTKKIKKGLGSLANTLADKLVPKELAPFLPLLAPMFMGPGASMLTRYLMPQLLTALSTGKTQGDISLTGQALTGLASFLSDPNRLKLSMETPSQTSTVQGATEIDPSKLDPSFLESDLVDPSLRGDFSQQIAPELDFGKMAPSGSRRSIFDATGGGLRQSPAVTQTGPMTITTPGTGTPFATPGQPTFQEFKDLSFGDQLRTIANEARDFYQGTNVANKFGGDEIPVTQAQIDAGLARFDPYASNLETTGFGTGMNRFSLDPRTQIADVPGAVMTPYASGSSLAVRDAGIMANLPRQATQTALLTTGPIMSSIEQSEDEAAAAAAAREAEMQRMSDARAALTNYYLGLSDPFGRFGAIDFLNKGGRVGMDEGGIMSAAPGMPQGMQVDGRNGTFIPMGVEEKADDVPAMLSKNEFVMTADAVRAMGNGDVNKGAQKMYDLMNSLEARA